MRKNGKYRFSLQFPAETEEQIQAGELLERLGNRKSAVVVAALGEYLVAHPALTSPECRVEITAAQNISSEQLREIVQQIIEEHLTSIEGNIDKKGNSICLNRNITEMLDNLDWFQ